MHSPKDRQNLGGAQPPPPTFWICERLEPPLPPPISQPLCVCVCVLCSLAGRTFTCVLRMAWVICRNPSKMAGEVRFRNDMTNAELIAWLQAKFEEKKLKLQPKHKECLKGT